MTPSEDRVPGDTSLTGIFGGTFDPPTVAHLIGAEWAFDALGLDELWFVPAGMNPFKVDEHVTPAQVRLAMLHAALGDPPRFGVSTLEIEREGPSYMIDTVEELKRRHPDRRFVLIQGVDSLVDLPKWHRYEDLMDTVDIAILNRPGFDMERVHPELRKRVTYIEMPSLEMSSTLVRSRVREGRSVHYMVPEEVERIIEGRGLYRS